MFLLIPIEIGVRIRLSGIKKVDQKQHSKYLHLFCTSIKSDEGLS